MRKYLSSPRIALSLILLITAFVYVNSLRYEFTYDDNQQIVLNSAITSASHLPEYFTTHVWASISPDAAANYYRPIFLIWLLLNFKIFGLSPAGWHATTVLVHLIATGLVYVLARRLTSDHLISAIAALLFGIHPVHIESVAWISGVTDPLMTVFLVAAFLMYLDSAQRLEPANPRAIFQRPFLLSLLFYTLAILTKETAVAFVPILICYEFFVGRKEKHASSGSWLSGLFVSVLPYVIVTIVYVVVRTKVLGGFS
jgi:dolichyl-phosphate-mannose--protein O-mannosyl transferase